MPRRVDTPGQITDLQSKIQDEGNALPPLLLEISLWRAGRARIASDSQKASLGMLAMVVLILLLITLAFVEALPGVHPGVAIAIEKISQALLLVIGVLLGVDWNANRSQH